MRTRVLFVLFVAACGAGGNPTAPSLDLAGAGGDLAPVDAALASDLTPVADLAPGRWQGGAIPSVTGVYGWQLGTALDATTVATGVGYFLDSTSTDARLVWRGQAPGKPAHTHFYGSLWTATFTSVTPGCTGCTNGAGTWIGAPVDVGNGARVDWDATVTGGDLAGFTFTFPRGTPPTPFWLDVYVDGARAPMLFRFPDIAGGGVATMPDVVPFRLDAS